MPDTQELQALKSRAYDLLVIIQQHQAQLGQVNEAISQLYAKATAEKPNGTQPSVKPKNRLPKDVPA